VLLFWVQRYTTNNNTQFAPKLVYLVKVKATHQAQQASTPLRQRLRQLLHASNNSCMRCHDAKHNKICSNTYKTRQTQLYKCGFCTGSYSWPAGARSTRPETAPNLDASSWFPVNVDVELPTAAH
jgi:hypothetical protein